MSLFDLLACPTCKTPVERRDDALHCGHGGTTFPIVGGVPLQRKRLLARELLQEAFDWLDSR